MRVAAAGDVARRQVADLAALGLDFDGEVVRQSERLRRLRGCAWPGWTPTSASAPAGRSRRRRPRRTATATGPTRAPACGCTAARRAELAATRRPALRVRAGGAAVHGERPAGPERSPGWSTTSCWSATTAFRPTTSPLSWTTWRWASTRWCRGDDLLSSSPRQAWLATRLGGTPPAYAHVPLAVNRAGRAPRQAGRGGQPCRPRPLGVTPAQVLGMLAESLTLAGPANRSISRSCWSGSTRRLPREPWVVDPQPYARRRTRTGCRPRRRRCRPPRPAGCCCPRGSRPPAAARGAPGSRPACRPGRSASRGSGRSAVRWWGRRSRRRSASPVFQEYPT